MSAASGRGVFDGNVKVNRLAQKTDAQQLSRNLLLVPRAQVNVKPNLQVTVWADYVQSCLRHRMPAWRVVKYPAVAATYALDPSLLHTRLPARLPALNHGSSFPTLCRSSSTTSSVLPRNRYAAHSHSPHLAVLFSRPTCRSLPTTSSARTAARCPTLKRRSSSTSGEHQTENYQKCDPGILPGRCGYLAALAASAMSPV